jgi:hypothetical protein
MINEKGMTSNKFKSPPPKGVDNEKIIEQCRNFRGKGKPCTNDDCSNKELCKDYTTPESPKKKLEFQTLGREERKILLKALDIDLDGLHCQYCDELLDYKKCSILPPLETTMLATILCSSPLCIITYLDKEEEIKKVKGVRE